MKIKAHLKLLISQDKCSGPRKNTLRYHKFEISEDEMQKSTCSTVFFDIRGHFEISMFEISRFDFLFYIWYHFARD